MPKALTDEQALNLFRDRWLTSSEAAQFLGLTWPDSIRKLLHDHPEIEVQKIGRDLFIPRAALERYRETKEPRGRKPSRGQPE